jgi:hypothetical protein
MGVAADKPCTHVAACRDPDPNQDTGRTSNILIKAVLSDGTVI